MSVFVRDVTFFDWRQGTLARGDLVVEAGPEGRLRPADGPPAPEDTVVEGGGRLACEGLTCSHHHIYSALARGMPAPPRVPRNFAEILELVWWRLDKRLDREMIRASALATGLDCLRCGVTRIVDHHASPNAIEGSLGTIAAALDELGLSHVLCYELTDRDGPERAAAGLAESAAYLESGRPALVGLHASFTASDSLLRDAVALARRHGTGLHVHVAEDGLDQERCLAEHDKRVVARFAEAGALDLAGTLLVHGLHLDDEERALIRRSSAWLAVNVESNQNNAVGDFRLVGLDPARILLGTDGMHSDMLRSARAAALAGGAVGGLDWGQAWQALWNGQRYLEAQHPAAARRNDLVLFDYDPPTPLAEENLVGHVGFGLDARHVDTVIAGGRIVVQGGRLRHTDERETRAFCRTQARRLWEVLQ